jgi:ribosomal protein S18 acetylase RimI-like enzyme
MFTLREFRGRGIGKALMSAATEAALNMEGIEQVNLSVASDNEPAKWLYRSYGFKPFGYERNAMKENGRYIDEEHWVAFLESNGQP